MTLTDTPAVLDCGHGPTVTNGPGTGYATRRDTGETMCYGCADSAAAAELAAMVPGDRVTHYVNSAGTAITTWSGGVLMNRVYWGRRHPWSCDRHYLSAVDVDGRVWAGTGANGMWATLRLTRGVAR